LWSDSSDSEARTDGSFLRANAEVGMGFALERAHETG
jgi:hypothetical protein